MANLVVLGGGESGVGAAILGKKEGFDVFLSDKGKISEKYKSVLLDYQIPFEDGAHSENKILEADLVIKSPGIPEKAPLIKKLREKNIEIISEIEFASRYTNSNIVAITGSNGKTTTTSLVYHILQEEGLDVGLGGNIGNSFARMVAEEPHEYYVLEVSSFQLDDVTTFKPHIAILLNITPDHLDRYEYKLDLYAKAKFKITQNQDENDYLIYNFDDPITLKLIEELNTKANKIPFSMSKNLDEGAFADDNSLEVNFPDHFQVPTKDLSLIGKHNTQNSMAAASAANVLKIRKETIRRSLSDFKAVEHRLEAVLKIGGIEFINDSKATNVNSVYYALESMKNPVIWIVGGTDKGNDYNELMALVKKKVRAIVCLGIDNQKIVDYFQDVVDTIVETKSMKEAVNTAYMLGKKGDTVLLSPACASFDLFENYEDRGNQFKKEVKNL